MKSCFQAGRRQVCWYEAGVSCRQLILRLNGILLPVGLGIAVAAASRLFSKWRVQELPDVSDSEFLKVYEERKFIGTKDAVLLERRRIANHLRLPPEKLAPDQEFKMLVNYTGFSTEYEVGMGDLEDEFLELYARLGAQNPPLFPETVGALISETLEAKGEK